MIRCGNNDFQYFYFILILKLGIMSQITPKHMLDSQIVVNL